MVFDKTHGFEKPGYSNSLNPEYIKLQRKEVVKKYQDHVNKLQEEILKKQDRLDEIENEINAKYKRERNHLENWEKALKRKDREIGDRHGELKAAISTFEKSKKKQLAEIEAKKREAHEEIVRAEGRIKSSENIEKRLRDQKKTNMDDEKRILELAKAIEVKSKNLERRIVDVRFKEGRLLEQGREVSIGLKKIKADTQAILDRELDLDKKEKSLSDYSKLLDSERNDLQKSAKEYRDKIKALNEKEQELKAISDGLKADRQELKDRETTLVLAEQNFRQSSAIKKRELDEREKTVKALEKKVR